MEFRVELPGGSVSVATDGDGDKLVVLGHGAGSSLDSKTVLRLRDLLLKCEVRVARFNFLYREQHKSIPDRMPVLMGTYKAVVDRLREQHQPRTLICGGHSMGGRTASMLAADGFMMDGLLLFGYPLHPAGKPEKLRDEHLPKITVPTLCFNGTLDELCIVELMEAVLPGLHNTWAMHWLQHADHSLNVKKSSGRSNAEVSTEIVEASCGWIDGLGHH